MPTFLAASLSQLNYLDAANYASPQAAIDYALENLEGIVHIAGTNYETDDTIHLGYGVGVFHTIQLVGQIGYGFATAAPETKLAPSFVDRPAINIQGGRNSGVDRVYIQGPDDIGYTGNLSLANRALKATYTPTGAADFENAPYCGVSIDAYYGTPAPDDPYPTPDYPAYLGAVTGTYNRNASSASFVTNSLISDTFIGVMQQPYADGNGDFTALTNTVFRQQYICIAIGNSQSRSVDYSNVRASSFHTFIDAASYGSNVGNIAGNLSNIHLDAFYQIFNFPGDWSVPFVVTNLYCEVGMRIGSIGTAQAHFIGCKFDCLDVLKSGSTITEERLDSVLSGIARFTTCQFYNRRFVFHFENECTFKACTFSVTPDGPAPTGALKEAAWGVLGGVINTPTGFQSYLNDTSQFDDRCSMQGPDGAYPYDGYDNDRGINIWSIGQNPGHAIKYDFSHLARISNESIAGSALGSQGTSAGHTLTLTMNQAYFETGDVFYDTGLNWWYVSAVSGAGPYTVTCKALTGYRSDGTNFWMFNATVLTTALYYLPRGFRDFVPRTDLFFKTTAASPTLEVIDGAGAAANLPAGPTTKSKPLWYGPSTTNAMGRVPFPSKTAVSAVNAQSLTMTANALVNGTWAYGPGIARVV